MASVEAVLEWRKYSWHKKSTVLAHAEIYTRLGVSDACGIALSLSSELYGQWYICGIAPENIDEKSLPDYSKKPYGSWTYDGSALDKTGLLRSKLFSLDQADKAARRRAIAYNFSGITPQHLFPTGLVRIRYITDNNVVRISWSTQRPEVTVLFYNIQTMASVVRVATALGLILKHMESYRFASPTELTH